MQLIMQCKQRQQTVRFCIAQSFRQGARLADSKAMESAVRGIYHGADGIKGHADLVAVEAQKGTAVVANSAAAMVVASMVVGQYYMNRINEELGEISDGISQITDFQDNEYRSRVFFIGFSREDNCRFSVRDS